MSTSLVKGMVRLRAPLQTCLFVCFTHGSCTQCPTCSMGFVRGCAVCSSLTCFVGTTQGCEMHCRELARDHGMFHSCKRQWDHNAHVSCQQSQSWTRRVRSAWPVRDRNSIRVACVLSRKSFDNSELWLCVTLHGTRCLR